jgi:carbamoyl-phosphate synthase large subunit
MTKNKYLKRILVSGCGPASINFIKSLKIAPEKIAIIGTDANKYHIFMSQADKTYLVPRATEPTYIETLNEIIFKEKIEFVHPQPDIEVAVLSENREKLKALTFLPSKKTVKICQNKFLSTQIWINKGIPTAKTLELKNEEDVEKAFNELGSPIWIRAKHGAGGRGSTPASNKKTALAWIRYWKSRNKDWEFIAQEYFGGRNIGFHSLFKNGELVISMARERLEYIYPYLAPSGVTGTPSVQRTIHDSEVNKIGKEAVLAVDSKYNGIACVDLKENAEGTPCPTEINAGRMFTTSYFFSYAGTKLYDECGMPVEWFSNIPYLYIKLAYKESIPQLSKFNILPKNLYWVRHMDSPARLIRNGQVMGTISLG